MVDKNKRIIMQKKFQTKTDDKNYVQFTNKNNICVESETTVKNEIKVSVVGAQTCCRHTKFSNIKKVLLFCAIILMVLNSVNAQTWNCGAQGNNLTATLSGSSPNYTLTISGSGDMEDYDGSNMPWYSYNSQMTTLIIEEGVTTIGNDAFLGCSGFTGDLIIPNSVTTIGNNAFMYCSGFTGSLTIGNSVTTIGLDAFHNCYGFTGSLTIGNSVTTIGLDAFHNCYGFTGDLIIPNSVTTIGNSAFYGCSGFTGDLAIGNSVETIENYAFSGCSGFTGDLIIPNSVTTIGGSAFAYCWSLTSITIGNSVTTIGGEAFKDCNALTSITVDAVVPPTLDNIGYGVFYGVPTTIPVYVPCGTASTYAGTTGWDYFTNFQGFISAPTNLTVTQQNATLELAWQNTGATSYEVWRNSTLLTTTASTTYTDSNVSNGTNYCYQIKAINGSCESQLSTAVCKTFNYIGIDNYELGNLQVFPNPTNGQITVQTGRTPSPQNIQIYDISGRIVQTQFIASQRNANEFTIDISDLQQGMYYLRIGNETVKIIKN